MKTGWIISSPEEDRSQCKCEQKVTSLKWTTLLLPICHWPWWYFTVEPKIKPSDLASCAILTLSETKNNFMAFIVWIALQKAWHSATYQHSPLWLPSRLVSLRGRHACSLQMLKSTLVTKSLQLIKSLRITKRLPFCYMKHQSVPFHV